MSSLQEQADNEDCEPCRFAVGIGLMYNVCAELEDIQVDCNGLLKKVRAEEITVKNFISGMKELIENSNGDMKSDVMEMHQELETLMFKKKGLSE